MTDGEREIDRFILRLKHVEGAGKESLPLDFFYFGSWTRRIAGHLYDGEQGKRTGAELLRYVRRKTYGFNPLLWFQLASLVLQLFRLWQEWRTPKGTWGFPVLKRSSKPVPYDSIDLAERGGAT